MRIPIGRITGSIVRRPPIVRATAVVCSRHYELEHHTGGQYFKTIVTREIILRSRSGIYFFFYIYLFVWFLSEAFQKKKTQEKKTRHSLFSEAIDDLENCLRRNARV